MHPTLGPAVAVDAYRAPLLATAPAEAGGAAEAPAANTPSHEQVVAFENSRLRRAIDLGQRLTGAGLPAVHWASGAIGASIVAASMALSTRRGSGLAEMATAETAAGVGTGMYLAGVAELLRDALACRSAEAVLLGAAAGGALLALVGSGTLLASAVFPQRLAGAVIYAGAVDGIAKVLSLSFARSHDIADPKHVSRTSLYLGAVSAFGCLLGASAVATGVVWQLGTFGVAGATVFGVTAGAHVLLSCCFRVIFVLYAQYRAAAAALSEDSAAV